MNCKKCGNLIETGAAFCTYCGTRVEYPAETPAASEAVQPEVKEMAENGSVNERYEQIQPIIAPVSKPQKEKVDFGKGALAFCLVAIGILSITTGVFAGLYFSVI